MSNTLSNRIRELRAAKGFTQAELAQVVGVSVQAVSKWECGGTPDVTLLPSIADFFGVSIDDLFGRKQPEHTSPDHYIVRLMQQTPENNRMLRACEIGWAAFKGISGIPNVYGIPFTEIPDPDDDTCTRGALSFNGGIAYANARCDQPSIFFMPEPKLGYNQVLAPIDDFIMLFRNLSDINFFNTVLFLYQSPPRSFSIKHICSSLEIPEHKMQPILKQLIAFGWLSEEIVELESGPTSLYRPFINVAFVGFLFFGTEILHNFKLWYMSNAPRSKPLLTKVQPSKNKTKTKKRKSD